MRGKKGRALANPTVINGNVKMNEFKTWRGYWGFERFVKGKNRYFRNNDTEDFLKTILATSRNRKKDLPKDRYLWRAQLGHGWEPLYDGDNHVDDIPGPYPRKRMKPLPREASEGRANPKGIPYLYLSTDKETAMSEVRPWLGSLISIGQFKTIKDMLLINCCSQQDRRTIYLKEPKADKKEEAVWSDISKAFSRPMTISDKTADYVPTQIIAEFFKQNGFDGIMYKSMLGTGVNVVLFDIDTGKLVYCNLFEASKLSFAFKQAGSPYIVKE